MSIVKAIADGSKGFDVNTPLTPGQAAAFKSAGYTFAIRYLPRTPSLVAGNLTAQEIEIILSAGLSIGAVQHVAMPGWMPNAALGTSYGEYAAQCAKQIGLPAGMNIWLDLEEVATASTVEDVSAYCRAWYNEVAGSGYHPGLYVGWGIKLNSQQLYELPFKAYWKAYNADTSVATRGYQIVQHTQKTLSGIPYDPNTVAADNIGDLPIFLSPL